MPTDAITDLNTAALNRTIDFFANECADDRYDFGGKRYAFSLGTFIFTSDCGTVCCIGGGILAANHLDTMPPPSVENCSMWLSDSAADAIGLDRGIAEHVFFPLSDGESEDVLVYWGMNRQEVVTFLTMLRDGQVYFDEETKTLRELPNG